MFTESFLNRICDTRTLPYLAGVWYAEEWLEHVGYVETYVRARVKFEECRATWSKIERALNLLDIHYVKYVKNGSYEFRVSMSRDVRLILEYLPLNYKFFRYM